MFVKNSENTFIIFRRVLAEGILWEFSGEILWETSGRIFVVGKEFLERGFAERISGRERIRRKKVWWEKFLGETLCKKRIREVTENFGCPRHASREFSGVPQGASQGNLYGTSDKSGMNEYMIL